MVLGAFIATFTYTLLVLRTVRSAGEDGQVFVPSISVSVAILLALVSIGFLIFYIHHAARSIRASVIIERVTHDTRDLVQALFPAPVGEPVGTRTALPLPATHPTVVRADRAGYLPAVDEEALFGLADQARLMICMEPRIGDFVLPGAALASVWAPEPVEDGVATVVRRAFVLGPERTLKHDMELGIRQLADIAIKALSPGINDPTTATTCIDRLAEIMVLLGNRRNPDPVRSSRGGRVRIVMQETGFGPAVALGFDQIRHYGAADARVVSHLLITLGRVAALVPPDSRAPLPDQADAALRAARVSVRDPLDLARVEQAAQHPDPEVVTAGPNGAPTPRPRGS